VSSWNVADGYLHVQGGWMEAIEESASDDVLGRLIRAALAASRTGVPTPDLRAGPTPERRKLLKLAGVRSETQHARGRRMVNVAWEDPRPDLLITPWRGDGKRGGGAYELTSQGYSSMPTPRTRTSVRRCGSRSPPLNPARNRLGQSSAGQLADAGQG
jgi:hypothetical protein